MPRRNRQKLHHELRLRAEALAVERRLRAQQRREEEDRSRRALELMRARQRNSEQATLWGTLRHLMSLARVSRARQGLVRRVVDVVEEQIPTQWTVEQLPWFLLLTSQPWRRPPECFEAPVGSVRAQRDALAEHLFLDWPAPAFLLRGLDVLPLAVARVPVEDEWSIRLLAHIGRGRSVFDLVGTPALPAPLTRRMCHILCQSPDWTPPVAALRCAQVEGLGGPRELAQRLLMTRLGRLHGPDTVAGEPFWHDVIAWLCRWPGVAGSAEELESVLGWIEAQRRAAASLGRRFTMSGRTDSSVRQRALSYARSLQWAGCDAFPTSGLLPYTGGGWEIVELADGISLAAEGEAMSHCVAMYATHLRSRKVAIFSLRCAGERRATVEVALGAQAVVQAKRKANAACTRDEIAVIARWASLNGLAVRC